MTTGFTFKKEERLCSLKTIGRLFTEGKSFYLFPIRVVYLLIDQESKFPVQAAFSVSKKNIRKASARNLLRRRMKEVYRQNKPVMNIPQTGKGLVVMFVYTAREILDFGDIEKSMKLATSRLSRIINS